SILWKFRARNTPLNRWHCGLSRFDGPSRRDGRPENENARQPLTDCPPVPQTGAQLRVTRFGAGGHRMVADLPFFLAVGALGWGLALAFYRPVARFARWPSGTAQRRLPAFTTILALVAII